MVTKPTKEIYNALETLKSYLNLIPPYPIDDDGFYLPSNSLYSSDPSRAAEIAREWCRELLATSRANGMGGCRLCRS